MRGGAAVFGIDVAAEALHVVALDLGSPPSVVLSELIHPVEGERLANLLRAGSVVAIDAPAARSDSPHDGDRRLPPKFRRARCGEVALRNAGHAVPFVSPSRDDPVPPWMATGLLVWDVATSLGLEAVETFPHAVFNTFAGSRLLHKQRPAGVLARAGVLSPLLRVPAWLTMWSHDGLDALAAAVVARQVHDGTARRVDCSDDSDWPVHDDSAIWLPTPAAMWVGQGRGGERAAGRPRLAVLRGGLSDGGGGDGGGDGGGGARRDGPAADRSREGDPGADRRGGTGDWRAGEDD